MANAWIEASLNTLSKPENWGYVPQSKPATEPLALAVLALVGHGRNTEAEAACTKLQELQNPEGSLGVSASETEPHWPTAWAILAWQAFGVLASPKSRNPFQAAIDKAITWTMTFAGEPLARTTEIGHDSTLIGWPWVATTHSWYEPTCLFVHALRWTGKRSNERFREGVRLLIDRLLPAGGANYGNVTVLGQVLRPNLQSSGLALLALAPEKDADGRIKKTEDYVRRAISENATAASLAYGIIGLSARNVTLPESVERISQAADLTQRRGAYLPRLSLLLLASMGPDCPLLIPVLQPVKS